MDENRNIYAKKELVKIFDNTLGKTLGDVDINNVFDRTRKFPKITGIAGDVVEQSILGYPADSNQRPDLIVDGVEVELKTTGIRKSKKKGVNYEAKEPMSITAVTPEKIVFESFNGSHFWRKIERLLLVYYLYDSETTVVAANYSEFPIKGYQFHKFSDEDSRILENDWTIVKDFISELQSNYEIPQNEYHRLSSELRSQLMMIDTAPKWPNRPRFRLKRAALSNIVQEHFGDNLEQLPKSYNSYKELDKQLQEFTKLYSGKTIEELISPNCLDIDFKLIKGDVNKSIGEQIVTKMFGANTKKMSKIDLFNKLGIIPKTITQTKSKTRTEDTKLFPIDFDEWLEDKPFDESTVYADFSGNQFLFIVFEEPNSKSKLINNKFLGFKRISFTERFIEEKVKSCWQEVRDKIINQKLKEIVIYKENKPIMNKNGTIRTKINFPKSKDNDVFLRGTGSNSKDKPIVLNGISMYRHNVWVKGSVIVEMLNSEKFI